MFQNNGLIMLTFVAHVVLFPVAMCLAKNLLLPLKWSNSKYWFPAQSFVLDDDSRVLLRHTPIPEFWRQVCRSATWPSTYEGHSRFVTRFESDALNCDVKVQCPQYCSRKTRKIRFSLSFLSRQIFVKSNAASTESKTAQAASKSDVSLIVVSSDDNT